MPTFDPYPPASVCPGVLPLASGGIWGNEDQAFYDEKYDPENGNYVVGLQFHPEAWACQVR